MHVAALGQVRALLYIGIIFFGVFAWMDYTETALRPDRKFTVICVRLAAVVPCMMLLLSWTYLAPRAATRQLELVAFIALFVDGAFLAFNAIMLDTTSPSLPLQARAALR